MQLYDMIRADTCIVELLYLLRSAALVFGSCMLRFSFFVSLLLLCSSYLLFWFQQFSVLLYHIKCYSTD